MHELIETQAALRPHQVAVSLDGGTISYRELDGLAEVYAGMVRDSGAARGDRVILYSDLSIDLIAAVIGILKAGCCVVTTHPSFPVRKLAHQTVHSGATVLVTDRPVAMDRLVDDSRLGRTLRLGGPPGQGPTRQGRSGGRITGVRRGTPDGDDLAAVFYTSGSSSSPKGVAISRANMRAAFEAVTRYHGLDHRDVVLSFASIGSDFGFYNIMMPLGVGARVVLTRTPPDRAEDIIELVDGERVTALHAFPSVLTALCGYEALDELTPPSLRYISSTGQRLPVGHIRQLRSAWPKVDLYSMYGLTECKRVFVLPPDEIDRRPDSVGKPIPGVRAYLVGDNGELVDEPHAVGELAVAGELVMREYWLDPEGTDRAIRKGVFGEERVLFTGDLFRRDEQGFHYWVARRDDAFSRAMFQVNPHEIEARLRRHPGVLDASVVPVPDDDEGETPVACVVTRPGVTLGEEELLLHCAAELDWHMVPSRVIFLDELGRTESGKTHRRRLRDLVREVTGASRGLET